MLAVSLIEKDWIRLELGTAEWFRATSLLAEGSRLELGTAGGFRATSLLAEGSRPGLWIIQVSLDPNMPNFQESSSFGVCQSVIASCESVLAICKGTSQYMQDTSCKSVSTCEVQDKSVFAS